MATSALPAPVEQANVKALTEAMAAANISSSKPGVDSASQTPGTQTPGESEGDLEDGEIRESDEEDDGRVKTVFDSQFKFNVKASPLS